MVTNDEVFSEDESPRKGELHKKDAIDNIIGTREPMVFKEDFINMGNKTCKHISIEDKHFVRLFNQKVRSKDPTYELEIPSNFKELMYQRTLVKKNNTARRKKVVFNMYQHHEESK